MPLTLFAGWNRLQLYYQILLALVLGIAVGVAWGPSAVVLSLPGKLILRLLGALAPPLILAALIHTLMTAEFGGRDSLKLMRLLMLNTLVAIFIGLCVANVIQPGVGAGLALPEAHTETQQISVNPNPLITFLDNVPKSLFGPLGDDGKVIGVIFIGLAFGIALRSQRKRAIGTVEDLAELMLITLIRILHWIIVLVPLAVFGIIASIVGTQGFGGFRALGLFVISVIIALALQAAYYLIRIRLGSWVRPLTVLKGTRDALVTAFSTASSTATMPVTFSCLRDQVGIREKSASLGAMVGANFNNDGTALYEAMAALFIAQVLGMHLDMQQQILVVLSSVMASVGAAGIPEAGLVTMTIVFNAVGLPLQFIPILLTVDWFLDRCRTAVNVMGDINVSCLMDGKQAEVRLPNKTIEMQGL
ncbi:C4-dicarboxylate transport protein DctA [Methyloglobulus morosus KoM1]|uniref:C4-dicarboxylate transport protein DctA n=1 Tax=Methyloglobulus morosus KoM1 TaxID=1116472 RepID=V5DPF9_9GAMM|nr:dicarboxylate/amino acid:cation symporter [Methyloglobulus morosus]ESS69326.1 C4-dicarboxylate transport protein DctA [Methyloglobulus morosus KoM1]